LSYDLLRRLLESLKKMRANALNRAAYWAPFALSPREREILVLVASGKLDKQVARELDIAVTTVRTHLERIGIKSGRRRRAELIALAYELDLVKSSGFSSNGPRQVRGLEVLEEALTHYRQLFDIDPTPRHRQDLAASLLELGRRWADGPEQTMGLAALDTSLTHFRRLFDIEPTRRHRRDLATVLHELGRRVADGPDQDRGLELLEEARLLKQL
jgi:DNA-binding CsgD family transcriptional regulator